MRRETHSYLCGAILAAACALAFGCGGKPSSTTTESRAVETVAEGRNDPCALLDPKEVEKVLGAPLGTPPFRSGSGPYMPSAGGSDCIYETADFHFIELGVDFSGGGTAYSMVNFAKKLIRSSSDQKMAKNIKQSFKLDDGTELSGEWDEATLTPMNCCIFNALRADQMISIDFTATHVPLRQAVTLVDAAYKRIDKPLPIDGGANVAAAKELNKRRPKPVDACGLLTRAEVEAVLGPLTADPVKAKDATGGCNYERQVNGMRMPFSLSFRWTGGYSTFRTDSHVAGIGRGMLGGMAADAYKETAQGLGSKNASAEPNAQLEADAKQAGSLAESAVGAKAVEPDHAWDEAANRGRQFTAVKKDVMVSIDLWGIKEDDARKLMVIVMQKF